MKKEIGHWVRVFFFLCFVMFVIFFYNAQIKEYGDSAMVLITVIYVVATIEICRANMKSAEATREQVNEAKREFEETQRLQVMPYLQLSFVDTDVSNPAPCAYLEMRNDNEDYTIKQALFSIKNIGLGIAHHTKVTVTTRYKKDDGYPAFDIVMPPNCEKSTYVQFNVKKYEGELGRREDIFIHIGYDDILGNAYRQEAQLYMVVSAKSADIMHTINMKSPQLISKSKETTTA